MFKIFVVGLHTALRVKSSGLQENEINASDACA